MQPVDVSWLVQLRWAAAALFILLAIAAGAVFHISMPLVAVAGVLALQISSNVALARWVARRHTVRASTVATIMALDTVLLTLLLALSGGPSNPFSVLYLVDVALGAVVLPPALTWALLLCALSCFGALFVPVPWSFGRAPLGHAELMDLHLRGMWVAFAVAAVTLVAFVLRVRRTLAEREAELARERERAVGRERLASLGTLAAGTAHALGTPLSTIAVAARELRDRGGVERVRIATGEEHQCNDDRTQQFRSSKRRRRLRAAVDFLEPGRTFTTSWRRPSSARSRAHPSSCRCRR